MSHMLEAPNVICRRVRQQRLQPGSLCGSSLCLWQSLSGADRLGSSDPACPAHHSKGPGKKSVPPVSNIHGYRAQPSPREHSWLHFKIRKVSCVFVACFCCSSRSYCSSLCLIPAKACTNDQIIAEGALNTMTACTRFLLTGK